MNTDEIIKGFVAKRDEIVEAKQWATEETLQILEEAHKTTEDILGVLHTYARIEAKASAAELGPMAADAMKYSLGSRYDELYDRLVELDTVAQCLVSATRGVEA